MRKVVDRIIALLFAFIAGTAVAQAQLSSPCAGNCEWELMMDQLMQDPSAISRYDIEDKVSRADLHHLSFMVNSINQISPHAFEDEDVADKYIDFLVLLIKEYGHKADFIRELSAGRRMNVEASYFGEDRQQIISNLRLVATLCRQTYLTDMTVASPSFETMNYGNLHFLERSFYDDDIVMSAKDPYYVEVLKRLCRKLDIPYDISAAEDDILVCIAQMVFDNDMETFSEIWKDVVRLRLCVNVVWQSDLNSVLMSYALFGIGMDAYLLEFSKACREYHSDELAKMMIPLYSLRMRSYEEVMDAGEYIGELFRQGKPYAEYLPWVCPPECQTEGFHEYREAFLKLAKGIVRTLGYEMNEMFVAQAQETFAPMLEFFRVSNLMDLLFVLGHFAVDMFYEGYNDAYTIIEDVLRIAETGYSDPTLMAEIANVYTDINYEKVEGIIDVLLRTWIEHRTELWHQVAGPESRIEAMLLTSIAGLTVNKEKYMSMAAEYVMEIEDFLKTLPEEAPPYYYVTLADVYSLLGMGYRAREIITGNLAELYKHNPENRDFAMFVSYFMQEDYENAIKYVKPALETDGVTYVLSSMETAFRTGQYNMAAKLADNYLKNRYLMTENMLMATAENKNAMNMLIRRHDVEAFDGILDSAYGKKACSDLLAGVLYDWNLISKGALLRSMQNWHSYMMDNDEKMFGAYDLYNAFRDGEERDDVPMPGEYASVVSYELSDLIRVDYEWDQLVPRLTSEDVIKGLSKGSYAIEFCNISDTYYAAVVGNGYKCPKLYRLCSKDDIMSVSVDVFTEYLYDDATSLRKLYDMVWEPVLSLIPEGSDIYCSLDGVLNLLNVELFCDDSSRYVGDVYDIYRVSTTASVEEPLKIDDFSNAVLYGNMNYFMNQAEITSDSDKYIYNAAEARYRGAVMDFVVPRDPLKETGNEIRAVSELLIANQVDTLLFEWNNGTEYSFKSLSGKDFDILHLATHGFWWGADRDAEGRSVPPMKRSGLVLSGSDDEPLSSDKAGVLFAQEIAELDLSAVDLVVLSACQTAGGEIHEDGVFGLQRGFKQAGVGTIVMTLWPVNSAMTQSFMTSMYGFLAQGYDTREAFYNARTEVRKHYKKASDWGAFIILD